MADYKELLRRAVEALPENNGAARRAVYEKARAALVGQLRAINPPLPARDITSHRLQLEDCIRQVEQEASEANIAGLTAEPPSLPPVFAAEARKAPEARKVVPEPKAAPKQATADAEPEAERQPERTPRPVRPEPIAAKAKAKSSSSIEDIIAAAESTRGPQEEEDEAAAPPLPTRAPEFKSRPPKSQPVLVARSDPPRDEEIDRPVPRRQEGRPLPSIVARAEAAKRGGSAPAFAAVPVDNGRRAPTIEPRRDGRAGLAATARQVEAYEYDDSDDVQAMTAVREVEVEHAADPQGAIDRAIATLDREARGEKRAAHQTEAEVDLDDEAPMLPAIRPNGKANGRSRSPGTELVVSRGDRMPPPEREARAPRPAREFANPRRAQAARAFDGVPRATPERRSGLGAVSIFAIIFSVLIVGAGGAGFWAWQEGFINLDQMFGKSTPAVTTAAAAPVAADSTGPGNTETPAANPDPETQLKANERLPTEVAEAPVVEQPVQPLALQSPATGAKTEERLGASDTGTAAQAVASIDPAGIAGSQSLLLEASDNGTTGAVPFSGTVDWSKGQDELGQPTLIGKASIPARNLSVEVLIRKNSDPSLPASHLMEINFTVSDSFIGGSIAGLPGVLLKNEELVQGAPLVGASARVVGNSFLFALSAASEDARANTNLLTTRKWMDLALIYASGKRAIITLEKDSAAQALFSEVFGTWGTSAASAG